GRISPGEGTARFAGCNGSETGGEQCQRNIKEEQRSPLARIEDALNRRNLAEANRTMSSRVRDERAPSEQKTYKCLTSLIRRSTPRLRRREIHKLQNARWHTRPIGIRLNPFDSSGNRASVAWPVHVANADPDAIFSLQLFGPFSFEFQIIPA